MNRLGQVWRLFASVRLALALIFLLTAAVLAGTLLMQAPPSIIDNPASYELWLERARGKYGVFLTDVFDIFQLFNVFHAVWFRLLLALLTANLLVSSIDRWKGVWTTAFSARIRMGDAFFQYARFTASHTAALPVSTTAERIRQALSRSRYRVRTQADPDAVAIYADRNRLSGFGSLLSHMSLVLILAGATVQSLWGFTDSDFIVAEGSASQLGLGTNISVGLEHFIDEYYLEGPPKDFRSEVVIYDKGVPVKEGTIRVNSPMSYEGIRFHQSFFGQTAEIEVADSAGQLLFSEQVPQPWLTKDVRRPLGSFSLPEQGMNVYVIGPLSGQADPLVPAG
jgi:cytochrome c biogenesis protein